MGFNLDGFTGAFGGERARAYQFEWWFPPPLMRAMVAIGGGDLKYLVKASSMPESTVETLTHYYQGAEYKVAGSARFSDWTVTVNCDPESNVRMACEAYMMAAHTLVGIGGLGIQLYGEASALGYIIPVQDFDMLNQDGGTSLRVILTDSWVKSVGPISLDYSSQEVASFDITFSYLYHMMSPI